MHNKFVLYLCFISIFLGIVGCSDTDAPEESADVTPQVIFLFSPGGLGDMSYNDCMLQGVQNFKKNHPEIDVFLYSPPSMEVAERIFTDWLKRPGSNIPVVFTLASSDYEPLMDTYIGEYELTDNKRILFFETSRKFEDPQIYTFQISMYGASFLAGVTAAEITGDEKSLVLLGSSSDQPIRAAQDGFIDGLGTNNYDIDYLADDWTGFVMANVTYQNMSKWSDLYGFIFPVAGGSNNGIYRYTREFTDSPFLAGMDIDQSELSTRIVGSVVKRLDLLIEEYFQEWLMTGDMPESRIYGLESGYVDWKLAPLYEETYYSLKEESLPLAIEKENEYH